jgi:hypothetical protein
MPIQIIPKIHYDVSIDLLVPQQPVDNAPNYTLGTTLVLSLLFIPHADTLYPFILTPKIFQR